MPTWLAISRSSHSSDGFSGQGLETRQLMTWLQWEQQCCCTGRYESRRSAAQGRFNTATDNNWNIRTSHPFTLWRCSKKWNKQLSRHAINNTEWWCRQLQDKQQAKMVMGCSLQLAHFAHSTALCLHGPWRPHSCQQPALRTQWWCSVSCWGDVDPIQSLLPEMVAVMFTFRAIWHSKAGAVQMASLNPKLNPENGARSVDQMPVRGRSPIVQVATSLSD